MAALLHDLCRTALDAGGVVLRHYGIGGTVRRKNNSSPVTDADEESEALILATLARLAPGVPVVAEEAVAAGRVPEAGAHFFLVDPLDGTREFIAGRPDFTVNIALVEESRPVLGVIYAPARSMLYFGGEGRGAFALEAKADAGAFAADAARPIHARAAPEHGLAAVASRSHRRPETDAFLKTLTVANTLSIGSSLKFCLLAEGSADIYPRHGPTMEWDTAAGDAILRAAGGSVRRLDGRPLIYGKVKDGFRNPHFIARGRET